jgi:AraC-like DNA-binding protein
MAVPPDLARLATETGYADQAHLTRESTRLAGLPPTALAWARRHGHVQMTRSSDEETLWK